MRACQYDDMASCQHGVMATWHHVNGVMATLRHVTWSHGHMASCQWSHGHVMSTWSHGHMASCQHGIITTIGCMATWKHGNLINHVMACNQWQIHVNHVMTCEWEGQGAIPACSSLCSTRPRSPCPPTGPFRSLRRPPSSLGQGTCRPPRVQWLAGPVLPLRPDLLVG